MSILNFENITKVLGAKTVLDNVSFGIEANEKVGVIGVNGTGKSTLLKIAAGIMTQDEGQITMKNGLRISFLPQTPQFDDSLTLLDNVASRVYGKAGHWNTEGEVMSMLERFGIKDASVKPSTLSGGQRKRAALVAAILTPSDILILDEPTNHLDHEMIDWLEDFLIAYKGAILMVTHDRYFLDEVTDVILELDKGSSYKYNANYEGYLELKQQRLDYQVAADRKMASLYRQDLAWMQRGARARSTKQKAHIQRFEQLRDREKIVLDRQVEIDSLASRIGGKTIELANVSKKYGDKVLFDDFSYIFLKTDRIGIIGPNGCGKSTLMKVITGLVAPDSGSVEIGQTIKIGFFSQENEELNTKARVIDYIRDTAEYIRTSEGLVSASEMCNRFLFDPKTQYTPIEKLSGGEKRRLYLLHVLMEQPNVLILDEPTNDLDIQTLQILEDYLDHFNGIIIAVSHDRYFLDRVVTRIFAFRPDGTLYQSEGAYEEYLEHMKAEGHEEYTTIGSNAVASTSDKDVTLSADDQSSTASVPASVSGWKDHKKPKKLSYKDQREYDTIEEEIDKLQKKSDELAAAIIEAASDYGKLADLYKEKEANDQKLEERMERYLELEEMIAELNN